MFYSTRCLLYCTCCPLDCTFVSYIAHLVSSTVPLVSYTAHVASCTAHVVSCAAHVVSCTAHVVYICTAHVVYCTAAAHVVYCNFPRNTLAVVGLNTLLFVFSSRLRGLCPTQCRSQYNTRTVLVHTPQGEIRWVYYRYVSGCRCTTCSGGYCRGNLNGVSLLG